MRNKKGLLKLIIFILIIIGIVIIDAKFNVTGFISNSENLLKIKKLSRDNVFLVFFAYILITVAGSVVFALPGITFAVIAGVLFGPVLGTIACILASTIGAMLAFLVGRFFLSDYVKPLLEKNKLLSQILLSEKNEAIILMITRLVPVFPYNLQNFAYGVTNISFTKYSVLSFLFMIPGTAIYTIGTSGLVAEDNNSLYFIVAAVLAVIVFVSGDVIRRKYLSENEGEE